MGVEDKENIFKDAVQEDIFEVAKNHEVNDLSQKNENERIFSDKSQVNQAQTEEPSPYLNLGNVIEFKTITDKTDHELSAGVEIELLERLYKEISERAKGHGKNPISKDYFDENSGIQQTRTIIDGKNIAVIKYPFTFRDMTGVRYTRHLLFSGRMLWEATKTFLPNMPGSYETSFTPIPQVER